MNEWLVVIAIFLIAAILAVGLPLIYMSGRARIDRVLDDSRVRLMEEREEWSRSQATIITMQNGEILQLRQDLQIERDARTRLEGRIQREAEYSKQLKEQVDNLVAQVARLQGDRDRLRAEVESQRIVINGLIHGVMILTDQLNENSITPKWLPAGFMTELPSGE